MFLAIALTYSAYPKQFDSLSYSEVSVVAYKNATMLSTHQRWSNWVEKSLRSFLSSLTTLTIALPLIWNKNSMNTTLVPSKIQPLLISTADCYTTQLIRSYKCDCAAYNEFCFSSREMREGNLLKSLRIKPIHASSK